MRTPEEIAGDLWDGGTCTHSDDAMCFECCLRLTSEAHALGRSEMEAEVERLRAEAVRDSRVIAAGWTKREALEAEIATLRSEISRWREVVGQGMEERDGLRAEVAKLRAESEERERALREALREISVYTDETAMYHAADRARAALRPHKEEP